MHFTPTLATRFARNTHVVRSELPLAEEQMRLAAPSIFAPGKHASRSERYTYIPTSEVRGGLGNQDTAISGNSATTDRARRPGKQKDHEQKTAPESLVDLQG